MRKQNGSITLYVLVACLFFGLIPTGVYISQLNKIQTQEEEVTQIEENYKQQLERSDEIYNELINREQN